MAEENGRENRNRKVIPYDQAFGANTGLTYTEPENEDMVNNRAGDADTLTFGSPDRDADATEAGGLDSPLEAAEPIGRNDRDPEDIRSEREDVEAAQEIAEPMPRANGADRTEREDNAQQENGGNGLGITGLILSLVSIFLLPAILAPAGIIVGYIAFRRGARTTGIWAMVIGAFALLMALLILPAYFR